MPSFSYDLHIHSALSPCGDNDMLPSNIVGMATLKGLDVIAVTDHNSCKNCPAVMKLAEFYGITAIPGMEICTAEEVHVLCLFPKLENAMLFDKYVENHLPNIMNKTDIFGNQRVCDEDDNIISEFPYLLINATSICFDELYDLLKEYDGIMIPAHIEKASNSMLSNLGFIPPDSKFSCVEIKHIGYSEQLKKQHGYLNNCNIITNSDAHYLEYINESLNYINADANNPQAIIQALTEHN